MRSRKSNTLQESWISIKGKNPTSQSKKQLTLHYHFIFSFVYFLYFLEFFPRFLPGISVQAGVWSEMSTRNRRPPVSSSSSTARRPPSDSESHVKKIAIMKPQLAKKRPALSDMTNQRDGSQAVSRVVGTQSKPIVRVFLNLLWALLVSFILCVFLILGY